MGVESIYYVPRDQMRWRGNGRHAVKALFDLGVPADLYQDLATVELNLNWNKLPDCTVDIDQKFGGLFIVDNTYNDLVPNQPERACCSSCNSDLTSMVYDSMSDDVEQDDSARTVVCESCKHRSRLDELRYSPEAAFAQFYLCVSECELDAWPKEFLGLIEGALGRCVAYEESTT